VHDVWLVLFMEVAQPLGRAYADRRSYGPCEIRCSTR
jgi:hypothetical protein